MRFFCAKKNHLSKNISIKDYKVIYNKNNNLRDSDMYKPLPHDEEYQKYQVDLLSKGESLFLSQHDMELDNLSELYEPGYQTYTGYRINLIEANSLNYLVKQHNLQTSKVLRKYFKDRIQQYLSICAEELTVDQIKAYESGFYDGQKVA